MSNQLVSQSIVNFIIQVVVCTATNLHDEETEMAFIWGETVCYPDKITELEKQRHRLKYNARAKSLFKQVETTLNSEMEMKIRWENLNYEGREAMVLYFE